VSSLERSRSPPGPQLSRTGDDLKSAARRDFERGLEPYDSRHGRGFAGLSEAEAGRPKNGAETIQLNLCIGRTETIAEKQN